MVNHHHVSPTNLGKYVLIPSPSINHGQWQTHPRKKKKTFHELRRCFLTVQAYLYLRWLGNSRSGPGTPGSMPETKVLQVLLGSQERFDEDM